MNGSQMTIDEMIVPNDRDDLIIQIDTLSNQVETLTSRLANVEGMRDRYRSQINRFEEQLRDLVSNEDITPEMAIDLATCFDFTLETEVQVTFSITVTGMATIPLGQDVDDIDWENEVYVDVRSSGDIEMDVYVDYFDAECEAV